MLAILILMLITSMGIFGFLSKAHIEQNLTMNTGVIEQIEVINNDIKSVEGSIADLDKQVAQIDAAIEKMTEKNRAENSLKAAEQQRKTRGDLIKRKNDEIKKLSELKTQKIKYESEFKKVEAEIGPIKYVGDMIYGTDDADSIDKAVRLVIMLIMIVFDPLAVLLLIAANMTMQQKREGTPIVKNGEIVGLKSSDIPSFTDTVKSEKEFFRKVKKSSKKLDKNKVEIEKENIAEIEEKEPVEEPIIIEDASGESIPPISKGKRGFPNRKSKELEPKYDYEAELAFKQKGE
jgi:hypothetical protein